MGKMCIALMAGALATFAGCHERDRTPTVVSPAASENAPVEQARPAIDACSLLTSDEIKSIQGEGFQKATPSGQNEGELASAQCFFALPDAANSISLHVVWNGEPGGQDAKQAWATMFSPEKLQVRETSSGKKKLPPRRIPDLGDEAFWTSTLYVLKGNHYFRISVGGADDEETKITKSSDLARLVLQRL
jgi:hypothetical protein